MLLIYSSKASVRLDYVLQFLDEQVFDKPARITYDKDEFEKEKGPKLNYSEVHFEDPGFHIQPVPLLFETGIRHQIFDCNEKNGYKYFFSTKDDFGFDVFASIFFLLSRYEEYLPVELDSLGRYPHQASVAYKYGFLHQPLVNIWMEEFRKELGKKYPEFGIKWKDFNVQLSYDIDMAYSFKEKGFVRNAGSFLRSLSTWNWQEISIQYEVLRGERKDPFDCFEWLDALHLYCRVKPLYFFLVAAERGLYDKNVPTSSQVFNQLIEYCAAQYPIGVHPSWQSGDRSGLIREEKEWLEVVADQQIIKSRQHYIRLSLPKTYRQLIETGITEDYSMGYGSLNGFRASVASSFLWYDLMEEKTTNLRVHPFCFMDTTAYYHQKLKPQEAYGELMGYYNLVKKHRGLFISIWHNTLLGSHPDFKGWPELYELFMKETVYWGA
jgi:hypothetical protein